MPRSCSSAVGQAPPQANDGLLEGFSQHRRFNRPISRDLMTDPATRDIGQKIANCALSLKASVILQPEKKAEVNLTAARVCNTRFCPFCEWRRTRVLRQRLFNGLTALYEDQPKLKGVFLTLTVKNCALEHLGDQLDQMNKAWGRMSKCSFFPTDLWFRRTEVTIGSTPMGKNESSSGAASGLFPVTAHPHFHVLLLVKPSYFSHGYIKKSEWQKQWQMALRETYAPVVDVRVAKSNSTSGSTTNGDARSAVLEAAKYSAKATSLMELGPAITELHWQLRRRRLHAMSKELAKYIKDGDISAEELMDDQSKPLPQGAERVEVMAQWFEDIEQYVITDCSG